ncbi:SDR family NAD(P)-dependent oxidoreductase [Terrimonas ferruginea]|uniref:SDR family NAD(P)-dependent oxidoreductase n=1 Tax=Terrimonas ferruginea TaxID=249 RepID=UPI000404F7D6|nr:SDR family oxidoreductase [Terrimonas ferruginea]
MYDLKEKVALVTGGASGIGQATAKLYALHGAKVVVSDLDEINGEETVRQIRQKGGEAVFLKTDVSDPAACEALIAATVKTFGSVDIAFNNAGISGESNPIGEMSIDGWKKIIAVNLDSVFYCMKYEIQQMQKQGKGAIVNMSSILGQVGFANSAGYVAAKHGVVGLTQNAALEYSAKGIRVNAVGPGFIDTPLLTHAGLDDATRQYLASQHAIGRLGTSDEVAELVIWLSSDKAGFVTGSYYAVDGGYLAH